MKDIPNYEGLYKITKDGMVWSVTSKKFIAQRPTTRSKYLYVRLYKNNQCKHCSVHRLVALTYIPNPNNLPEVDHIDNNILNNNISNLRWCSRKFNLYRTYTTMSPVRNFRECSLYQNNQLIKSFKSVAEASRYARDTFNLSYSSIHKYRKVGSFEIRCNDYGR